MGETILGSEIANKAGGLAALCPLKRDILVFWGSFLQQAIGRKSGGGSVLSGFQSEILRFERSLRHISELVGENDEIQGVISLAIRRLKRDV